MIKLPEIYYNDANIRGLIFYLADRNSWEHNCACLIEEIVELELVFEKEHDKDDFRARVAEETADVLINMCVVNEMFAHDDSFNNTIECDQSTGFVLIKEITKFMRKRKYSPSFWMTYEIYLSYLLTLIGRFDMKENVYNWMKAKTDRYWKRHNNGEDTN